MQSDTHRQTLLHSQLIQNSTPRKYRKINQDKIQPTFNFSSLHLIMDLNKCSSKNSVIYNELSQNSSQKKDSYQRQNYSSKKNKDTIPFQLKNIDEQEPQPKLNKRLTMQEIRQTQTIQTDNLSLFRHNSTFDAKIVSQDIKYGDNIYIQQITSLTKGKSYNNFKKKKEEYHQSERLLNDYEIKKSLHQNYICLNKIERILYYVKKLTFSINNQEQFTQKQIFEITNLQIHLSSKDQNSLLLRFFQSWTQSNSLYMIFQLASASLEQKTNNGIRLHEYEVWSVLTDCSKALAYLFEQKYCHLNIKPGNILKCRQKYKLSDPLCKIQYLVALLSKNTQQFNCFYHPYIAPELLSFLKYTQGMILIKADIYSLGMCILQNLLGLSIISLKQKSQQNIKTYIKNMLSSYSPKLKRTMLRMISKDPSKRPYPKQLFSIEQDIANEGMVRIKRKLSL